MVAEIFGPQPENILFLIHEVLENLICEFYKGIKYHFSIPCIKCIQEREENLSMIASFRIKKAIKKNVPFIQCLENYHTLSLSQLQGKKKLKKNILYRLYPNFLFPRFSSTRNTKRFSFTISNINFRIRKFKIIHEK